ncbi:hypothetical protein ACR2VJ_27970 [Klebsiella pneumoniae]
MSTTVKVGKYTYVVTDDGRIEILRHGETWRTETGDNALLALIMEVEALNKVAECATELMRKVAACQMLPITWGKVMISGRRPFTQEPASMMKPSTP